MTESQRLREYDATGPFDAPLPDGAPDGVTTDHTVWSCVGNLTAVRSIRARVRDFLSRTGHAGPILDDAELAVSELATNALLHSRSGRIGGVMTLYIRVGADRVRVAIADQGAKDADDGEGRVVSRQGEGDYGRGKLIIDSCTSRSGEYWTEATHVAWFEIDVF
ncbi:ATP-binding protein [Marinactinospora thermotolerans]|uniref:Anti-sigma regulatory factor (Ser/Thr protein kinase) n=1 Tax=Marinactinospora thermotolerans DSM 45154 TaxID=1122192 RepID=A0A1T4LC59_9ACTN|nr:ATP-binding protein [Marinactinospora thermotolerans]SJZ52319.1 Anti-sigma regulatory factor (Ser/Thr protein kinase) [Marinactinospora thermotolerans DSM 45154]